MDKLSETISVRAPWQSSFESIKAEQRDSTLVNEPIAKAIVARLAGIRIDSEILSAIRVSPHGGTPGAWHLANLALSKAGAKAYPVAKPFMGATHQQ